ncbi:LysR family transcriptional regulator [Streptococcus pneumoniae]|jgi:DNA-binding transcriptional LysR family regulator|uniref:LysR family transcriptional regulator n=5 Tax=Stutzerimonas stutzeri group TaxID=136846 RepID=A0A165RS66_STUST|nr:MULTISPECIES: LysR family transcriptional regulator [Pseudomonadaceae]EPL61516.1 transcriptional regulator [Stutzerimonas stutzeri B1SMN1]MBW8337394.1 LysR family transcriptional regulator [Pseudomonas sp.]NMY66654.1 LysR family transcriptional regulator [Pseudomonas sp. WS 5018]RRU94101.1 LysR family transcriptional regulator [Stutzerimonas xanthomarina]CJM42800.1 LysR family transcriptional regulator [Streptococcus pneumoniae]|tara:strand:- start:10542 stop:11435 length:894 start_codon:yes stop_codon:yes gene_type:complete
MATESYDQLAIFAAVAQERSFTRAAAKLGMSQPALSRAMRQLEERLGVRLLARTTRSVAPTEAGEHLLRVVAPRFEEIDSELGLLSEFRDKPAGKLRLTAGEHAAITILQPVLATLLPDNPDLSIEVIVDYGLTDIVAEGYDAGVRLGQQVAKDMIAMRIGPDMRMAVVGSPAYFARHPQPVIPRDLMQHNCINIRMPTYGGIFPWEFEKNGEELKVRVEGQLVFNNIAMRLGAALQGLGLAYMAEDLVQAHVAEGRLIRVLEDWCEPFSGYHLYYPSRRQSSPAFTLLRDALRYPG